MTSPTALHPPIVPARLVAATVCCLAWQCRSSARPVAPFLPNCLSISSKRAAARGGGMSGCVCVCAGADHDMMESRFWVWRYQCMLLRTGPSRADGVRPCLLGGFSVLVGLSTNQAITTLEACMPACAKQQSSSSETSHVPVLCVLLAGRPTVCYSLMVQCSLPRVWCAANCRLSFSHNQRDDAPP